MKSQRRGNHCPEMWDQISQRYCNMHGEKKDCPALIHSARLLISHFTISMAPWWKIKPQWAVFSFPNWKRSENLCCIEQLKNSIYSHTKICWPRKASFCWFSNSFWPSICTEKMQGRLPHAKNTGLVILKFTKKRQCHSFSIIFVHCLIQNFQRCIPEGGTGWQPRSEAFHFFKTTDYYYSCSQSKASDKLHASQTKFSVWFMCF